MAGRRRGKRTEGSCTRSIPCELDNEDVPKSIVLVMDMGVIIATNLLQ